MIRGRAAARAPPMMARRVACRAEPPKFSKIEGDKRVVRGKVFVCQDVRPTFLLHRSSPTCAQHCHVALVFLVSGRMCGM